MATSISVVQAAQPDGLADAAAHTGESASRLEQHLTAGRQALTKMRAGWEGTASDAASASAERTFLRQQRIVDALHQMHSALSSGGGQLSDIRNVIVDNVSRLEQVGYQVADDGTVSVKPGSRLEQLATMSPTSAMQIRAAAASNSLQLKTQLANFDAQDHRLARALQAATAELAADQAVSTVRTAPASYPGETQGGELDLPDPPEFWTPGLEPIDPDGAAAGPGTAGRAPI